MTPSAAPPQAAPPQLPAPKTSKKDKLAEVMEKVRELNRNASLVAAHGLYQLVEDVAVELQGADLETRMKGINVLRTVAMDVEKVDAQKATTSAAQAFFNVIMDVNAKQIAPPKDPDRVRQLRRSAKDAEDVEPVARDEPAEVEGELADLSWSAD